MENKDKPDKDKEKKEYKTKEQDLAKLLKFYKEHIITKKE